MCFCNFYFLKYLYLALICIISSFYNIVFNTYFALVCIYFSLSFGNFICFCHFIFKINI